jgi:hypothetical protein
MQPEWMNEKVACDEGAVAFGKRPTPFVIRRAPGEPRITVLAEARCEVVPVLVRVPRATMERWRGMVRGGTTVAIGAAMELLMDDLEEAGEAIVVDQA